MFLSDIYPSIGRLSPKNPKTPMILGYRRQQDSAAPSSAAVTPQN
jgi:hypothetical protein